jgi:hypothetical protein
VTAVVDSLSGARSGEAVEPTRVPWLTVLPLAVALAYADGFWVMSLRGTVGAIDRVGSPSTQWLLESTVALPVFVLAVLAALTLAQRRFGPVLRRRRTVLATGLLVAAAGTVAGFVELAASSAYDYHLQSGQIGMMTSMGGLCVGACEANQVQATLDLQLRAVGWGSLILLATNLLVVGWVTAVRGGRLDPAAPGRSAGTSWSLGDDLGILMAGGLLGSAVVHAAVIPEHLEEWTAAGAFFIVLTVAEVAAAAAVVARPGRLAWRAAAALSLGPLVLWACSRTLGMPFGPGVGVPEAVGVPDCAACLLELGTLVVAVALLGRGQGLARPSMSAHVSRLALTAVVAIALIGLATTGLGVFERIAVASM